MRIHLQGFIRRRDRKQAWVKQVYIYIYIYIYGQTKSSPTASIGLRSAKNIQQGKAER